ncbi:WD repeat-containing 55-like [Brachionus plicatilis]|uniref:WD repeat-containing 55-like n=1 Tax=Brachionus plicatilis TaxID=10195 RepID=A0A3M7T5W2_BRAPC|nr:WD repeat-containing 55-like [Brachionus plicatilis]
MSSKSEMVPTEEGSSVNLDEKEQVYSELNSKIEILDILFHPSENNILNIGLINGKLKIYDVSKTKKRLVSAQKIHKKSIRKISFPVNNSNTVFTASKDKSIKLTDIKQESNILTIENAHESPINCLVTIDNWLIASADDDGAVKIWDYRKKDACMESKSDCSDYISDLAVSSNKKVLLATCGEGTLNAFHIRKKKLELQSELMDSELLCVGLMKGEKKVICGTGEGVIDIFNYGEWGNISDRFPGHPSSIDCMATLSDNVVLTGCFDGNIRACHILPNRFLGVVGNHNGFPIHKLNLSSDKNICASLCHDQKIKFWNVENLKHKNMDAQSKSKNKSLKNTKLTAKGKSENFFADLVDGKDEDENCSDDSDEEFDSEECSDSDDESD